MISKINKIKNLGIFTAYTPIATLKDFKKYNLIYGWNGSGKTTFSKLFDTLEAGVHTDFPTLEYEIQNESSTKFQQGHPFNQKVRVFNQDYIQNNLQIIDGKAKAITLVLGNASKETHEQLAKDEAELSIKISDTEKERMQLDFKEKTKGKSFTEIAKTIFVAITGGATRNYRKDNAESDFALLTAKELLTNEQITILTTTVKQLQKPLIDPIKNIEIVFVEGEEKISLDVAVADILREAKLLLSQKVESIVIDRMQQHQDISNWVEAGLEIHHSHNSSSCEYCGQEIPKSRIQELAQHFNSADKKLKQDVDVLLEKVLVVKEATSSIKDLPDSARLYDELNENYQKATKNLLSFLEELLISLEKIRTELKRKKSKTTEAVEFEILLHNEEFNNAIIQVNSFIDAHNKKTTDFETAKKEATEKIKKHYLSTIFDEVKVQEKAISEHKAKIELLTNGNPQNPEQLGIVQLKMRITENRAKISSTHKACDDINHGLATFLGRKELLFEPHITKVLSEIGQEEEFEDGYIIKRNGKIVTNLSEGEKTAIAFVYFTIHLNEPSFDKQTGIVVIDDPISSLDSNSIFQAFSFLKNSVKDVSQVFMLTHNFDFLRLVLNWLGNRAFKNDSSFYMLKNMDTADGRAAFLDELDKDLQEHESEYNYLFKLLYNFKSDGTIASVYNMPNLSRKVLETFLMFRVPNNKSTFQKLELLKPLFDENKITAIYKFTNDQSHITGKGFDPCLVPETQNVVKNILELIETTFPEHYKILVTP